MYVNCSLVVTCWERAELLALLCVMFLYFCHFPIWCPGEGVVLDGIISDLCLLSYLQLLMQSSDVRNDFDVNEQCKND